MQKQVLFHFSHPTGENMEAQKEIGESVQNLAFGVGVGALWKILPHVAKFGPIHVQLVLLRS